VNEPRSPQVAPSSGNSPPSLATPDDRLLIDACLAGDQAGWNAFVGRFAGLFAHIAARTAAGRRMPLSTSDRDDLVADVLLACVRNDAAVLRAYAGRASLATYLTVVARRIVVRALVRRLESGERTTAPLALAATPAPRDDLARTADREQVESLLHRLDTDEAKLVRLHHLEGRSYGEISRLTGMPLGSIGPALSRAKAKMRA
jgi:RNA polymerase sigma-70 factor (ECF subfamily)